MEEAELGASRRQRLSTVPTAITESTVAGLEVLDLLKMLQAKIIEALGDAGREDIIDACDEFKVRLAVCETGRYGFRRRDELRQARGEGGAF